MKWAEIAANHDRERLSALSAILATAGHKNQIEFLTSDTDRFGETLKTAFASFDQIRIGREFADLALNQVDRSPSTLLTMKVADAFVKEDGAWWPRCFLAQGLHRAIVTDLKGVDTHGAALIVGTGSEARAAVAALARLGFSKFSVTDVDQDRIRNFIEQLKSSYFGVQFQSVSRQQITQLPSVHTVALNTLVLGQGESVAAELFYFNFLKSNGVWLDLSFQSSTSEDDETSKLATEARAVGARVASGLRVAAWTDVEWARHAVRVELNIEDVVRAYSKSVPPVAEKSAD